MDETNQSKAAGEIASQAGREMSSEEPDDQTEGQDEPADQRTKDMPTYSTGAQANGLPPVTPSTSPAW